jgi:argininosuccinate lyase|tara:strand:+ start:9836 stop:11227 length:1392 start_codon:yes stop_codon:yes gene_type:complete
LNNKENKKTSSVQGGKIFGDFTSSFDVDIQMFKEDIEVSIAYSTMLFKIKIISENEMILINSGLKEIKVEIEKNKFLWDSDLEDIHLNIENALYKKIGEVAGKLHFGRSRNDQVSTDTRLFFKRKIIDIKKQIHIFLEVLLVLSEKNIDIIMPGYTHLQRGQPILLSQNLMSYFSIISRDLIRFENTLKNTDIMPLGSGAFAGVSIPIDREFLAKELGFKSLTKNSIDAVSSRDHILDLLFSCTSLMINVSRICEELIIWNSNEFGYINLSDEFTTGSSIMPQKRNPDYLELIRGKTGGVVGELMSLITTLKGLTFTYNRDLQEDRQGAMSSVITVIKTLEVLSTLLSKTTFNKDKMIDNAKNSNILATDFADYLAFKKIPFREAYEIIKKISDTLSKNNKYIHELSLIELQKISPLFEKDVLDINLKSSIEKRNSLGGTSTKSVKNQILEGKKFLITQENGK